MAEVRKTVFVSYSHKDRKWADELLAFLAPWIREKRVDLWDDSRIRPGEDWALEIGRAIDRASVAVLLVSKDFFNSAFIAEKELPKLVERASREQIRLIWIAVDYSPFEATPLAKLQAANDPKHPLAALARANRNEVMVGIAKTIADAATIRTLAGSFRIIDETIEPIEAALERRPERKGRPFSVQAEYKPSEDRISFRGAYEVITAEDLVRLPEKDREFIADLEDSLDRNYQRWRAVRKTLGDAGGALDDEVEKQLTRITKLMCQDLNSILDFLRDMHKAELEDHYGRYRFICGKLAGGAN